MDPQEVRNTVSTILGPFGEEAVVILISSFIGNWIVTANDPVVDWGPAGTNLHDIPWTTHLDENGLLLRRNRRNNGSNSNEVNAGGNDETMQEVGEEQQEEHPEEQQEADESTMEYDD